MGEQKSTLLGAISTAKDRRAIAVDLLRSCSLRK